MNRQVIVTGDTLAPHGGVVVDGAATDAVDGKRIARKGDPVNCAEHGVNVIAEGDASMLVDGKAVAVEGHRASCGCVLLSRNKALGIS